MKQAGFVFLFLLLSLDGFSQFGGGSTYDFLNLSPLARINALGGTQVGISDSAELGLSFYNPALLVPSMHNHITLSYTDYLADINMGYVAYARHIETIGTFSAGIHYINYGKFDEALENGRLTGTLFTAADYALYLSWSRPVWNKLCLGVSLKPVYSVYESYSSFGIASDIGFSFTHSTDSTGIFTAGLVFKNMGVQISPYAYLSNEREPLPFDIQLGASYKLAYAPFRFHVTFNQLHRWNLSDKSTWDYDHREEDENISGKSDDALTQALRHVILGVEFIPTRNFIIGLGYNYQRMRELSVSSNPGAVGLSGGFTVKISKFRLSYALASFHLSGLSHTLSVGFNPSELKK
ncbi:MAG TPA: type IX secretion system protein PorQ [Prolixibacteraceae bacterium]|nr:type IX secretion system protein PorQ [Prolixibacteraceae bacterium]